MTTPFDDPQAELAWMFLQCLSQGTDTDECFELLSEDFAYWRITTRQAVDKQTLRREFERRGPDFRVTLDLVRCINEGENVVIEADCHRVTAGGAHYDSPVVFLVDTRDGQILSIREYTDTRSGTGVFG